jgi:hypothetical protein
VGDFAGNYHCASKRIVWAIIAEYDFACMYTDDCDGGIHIADGTE